MFKLWVINYAVSTASNWLLNNLVSYYDMEDGTDVHGSNDLTISWTTTVTGKIWNAQSFDWSNDGMTKTSYTLWIANIFSVFTWFKPQASVNWHVFTRRLSANTNNLIYIQWLSGWTIRVVLHDSSGTQFKAYDTIDTYSLNTYIDYWVTWDWTTLKIYIDWTEYTNINKLNDSSWTMTNSTSSLYIWNNINTNQYINADIDELWIRSSVLTATEISDRNNSWNWLAYSSFTT